MREIKFRGWHTVQGRMFSAEEMAADQLALLPTGQFINVSSVSTRLSEIYPKDKFIPLQYTGLRDESGKEIYEGDIARRAGYDNLGSIVFFDCAFIWQPNDDNGDIMHLICCDDLEVIGNIYENPELLKEEREGK